MGRISFKYKTIFFLLLAEICYSQNPINKGFNLLETGKFSEAEVFFENFIKKDSLNKTAKLCYGRAVGLNGNPQKAKEIFEELLIEEPKNLEFLINYTEAFLWNKEYQTALPKYHQLDNDHPGNAIVKLGLANTYSNLKKHDNAISNYNKGIEIDKNVLGLYIGLAYTHRANNQDKLALDVISKGLLVEENNTELLKLKGIINNSYKVSAHQNSNITNDSGDNSAKNVLTYVNIPINTKNSIDVIYQYRNTENAISNDKATQNTFGVTYTTDITNKVEVSGNLSYLLSNGKNDYDNLIYAVKVLVKPQNNQFFSINYQREYHNFNAELIDSKIAQNHYFANYHILTKWNIGWFTQYFFTHQSDDNNKNLWFNSIYYVVNKKYVFKFGINSQIISFKEERPEIYFSPKQFNAIELFIDLNVFNSKSKFIANGNLATGYQFVNKDKQETIRGELNLGYKIIPKFNASVYGKYSNLSSGTAAGFEYNELGVKFNYTF
jgi:tetratricopeptide (TPR) repeat protein